MPQAPANAVSVLLGLLMPGEVALLHRMLDHPAGVPAELLRGTRLERLCGHPALIAADRDAKRVRIALPEVAAELRQALTAADAAAGPALMLARIRQAQAQGDFAEALELFEAIGGALLVHAQGAEGLHDILAGFPEEYDAAEPVLAARVLQAMIAGERLRARRRLARKLGDAGAELGAVLADRSGHSARFRLARFVMTLYDAEEPPEAQESALYDLAAELAPHDSLGQGAYHHAMAERLLRRAEFATARDRDGLAQAAYRRVGLPRPQVQIALCRAAIELQAGQPAGAELHLAAATEVLAHSPEFAATMGPKCDLLAAAVATERGDLRPMVEFLGSRFTAGLQTRLSPSLSEIAMNHGALALARQVALPAARVYLSHWRDPDSRGAQFQLRLALREVTLAQNANRWQEAGELLGRLRGPDRRRIEAANADLSTLAGPDEIAVALAWLRQLIWEDPLHPRLGPQIASLIDHPTVTDRQRITLGVFAASLARSGQDISRARLLLSHALELARQRAALLPLLEDRLLVEALLSDRRIGRLLASGPLRGVIQRLRNLPPLGAESARRAGLTKQETKVLLLLAEGGSNKHIARQLGLSEVTVKFHLSNLYRKLGCRSRVEALATTRALQWVA